MDTYLFLLVAMFVALALLTVAFSSYRPSFLRKPKHARGIVRGSRAEDRARVL